MLIQLFARVEESNICSIDNDCESQYMNLIELVP